MSFYLGLPYRPLCTYALQQERVWLIRDWVQECNEIHDHCKGLGITYLLTRLVDIGRGEGSNDCCLVNMAELPGSANTDRYKCRYITLSYCWGSVPFLKAEKSSLESLSRQIPLSSLPQVFQDLFSVSRVLGVRYVWIDALCIIQDDESD